MNVGTGDGSSDHVFLVNKDGEHHFEVKGKVGYPYFGQLILDCINRTENAMTQEHAFKAAEALCEGTDAGRETGIDSEGRIIC